MNFYMKSIGYLILKNKQKNLSLNMKSSQLFEIIMQKRKKGATKCTIKSVANNFFIFRLGAAAGCVEAPLGLHQQKTRQQLNVHVQLWSLFEIILLPRISIASKGLRHIHTDLAMLHFDE